jgi:cytochrome P450 family 4
MTVFGYNDYCITRASDAEKILSNSTKHIEKGYAYRLLHPFLKTSLLTSGGEKWHTRRRMLTPAFHFSMLKEFCEIFK